MLNWFKRKWKSASIWKRILLIILIPVIAIWAFLSATGIIAAAIIVTIIGIREFREHPDRQYFTSDEEWKEFLQSVGGEKSYNSMSENERKKERQEWHMSRMMV